MLPVLFEIGPFKVYGYGLMLGIAFLLGSFVLARELARKNIDPNIATVVTILSVIFGISGAKILYLIEDWDYFIHDPLRTAFSAGGLTWYGGFALGMLAVFVYIRRKKVPYLRFLDALGMALIIAYGVGRIGCHLSGDGDYGYPTTLPWGTIYAQGTAKPSIMLEEYFQSHPQEAATWHYDSLKVSIAGIDRLGMRYSRFDAVTPLHPTPVYEFILGVIGFGILWTLRKRLQIDGTLFMVYLMMSSVFRFCIEFMRLNPRLAFGLSEAQLLSIALFLLGLVGLWLLRSRPATAEAKV